MGGLSNNPLTDDYSDPYLTPQMRMKLGLADLSPSSSTFQGGFRPDSGDQYSGFWRSPYADEMMVPQVASSGSTGQGASMQPEADTSTRGPSGAAGALMNGKQRSAPPPAPSAPSPYVGPVGMDQQLSQGPPTQAAPQRMPPPGSSQIDQAMQRAGQVVAQGPPQQIGQRPQDIDPETGKVKTGAKVASVMQRLALAVLSATKLAPYAQQIVHPAWSQQMGAYEGAEQDLSKLAQAQEAQQRGQYYEQQANESKGRYLRVGTGVFDQQAGRWVTMPMDKTNLVPVDPDIAKARGLAPLDDGKFWVPAAVAAQIVKPARDPQNSIEISVAEGQRLGLQPDVDGKYYVPKEGIGSYISGKEKPPAAPTSEAQKIAYQNILSKLSAEGLLPANAASNVGAVFKAIDQSRTLTPQEKNDAKAFATANTTPASQGTQATIRVEGMGAMREYPVLNSQTHAMEMRSAADINANPGLYAPAGQGAQAMTKQAIFGDIHYNIQNARQAISALDEMDPQTRAQLAYALRDTDPRSSISSFLTGAVGSSMTPQQQDAVIALRNLSENALLLRSMGMGQGSDQVRNAILATIPGPKSASKGFALKQLDQFEGVVNRLEKGVPTVGGPSGGGSGVDRAREILFGTGH